MGNQCCPGARQPPIITSPQFSKEIDCSLWDTHTGLCSHQGSFSGCRSKVPDFEILYDGSVYLEGAEFEGPVWQEALRRAPEQRLGGVELCGSPCGASGWIFESEEGSRVGTEAGLSQAGGLKTGEEGSWRSDRCVGEGYSVCESTPGEGSVVGRRESIAQEREQCSRYGGEEQVRTLAEVLGGAGRGAGSPLPSFLDLEEQESVVLESLDREEEELEEEEFFLASEELVQLEQLVDPTGVDRDGIGLYRFCRYSTASPEVFNVSRGGRLGEVENMEPNNINEASVKFRRGT